jgi:hypothetical protein
MSFWEIVVTSSSKHSLRIHRFLAVMVTAGCVVWWPAVLPASAQEFAPPIFVASLSVAAIPPEVILHSVRERPDRPIPVLHRKTTDANAWDKFEAEYRPEPRGTSSVISQIETAKYGLDSTAFAVDRFVKSIRNHADFEFDQGSFRRTRPNPRGGILDNPRIKLDLDLTHGKPYIGARLVFPFGN